MMRDLHIRGAPHLGTSTVMRSMTMVQSQLE
jgi:hypothetical protein